MASSKSFPFALAVAAVAGSACYLQYQKQEKAHRKRCCGFDADKISRDETGDSWDRPRWLSFKKDTRKKRNGDKGAGGTYDSPSDDSTAATLSLSDSERTSDPSSSLEDERNCYRDVFLPKFQLSGGSCKKKLLDYFDECVSEGQDPTRLKSFLRPWQVEFFEVHLGLGTAEELLRAYKGDHRRLIPHDMHVWLKKKNKPLIEENSCFLALSTWAKIARSIVRFRNNRAPDVGAGVLQVSFSSDVSSVSSLGCESVSALTT
uniref:Uncharacterized protein n=1 Tax=Odontella aurita TaxID=265563 RepID=A0A7S4JXN1_9STRA|mmetsp:Transcript_56433/g.168883  ORF Transcript_56433/g.168883 Transcript_56433/m.168883 type:complete len:261 (+) Transcript_56433:166-948(+)|eukprot:CAMPEP_0113529454 /NCGR_PEP_ID=MMETSP0015_2-20120614/2404_1 /TAXON_ID=2838 /ORGANISM="Odontella" /LENGTH=260 /DNA_ID=CAMNT_0000428089 /DNA_START=90 /DNA_END=875 /DNA_ORIENTATION=+ /assembly_acc=CAM_ASM_000160